jgi:hypothetical protein
MQRVLLGRRLPGQLEDLSPRHLWHINDVLDPIDPDPEAPCVDGGGTGRQAGPYSSRSTISSSFKLLMALPFENALLMAPLFTLAFRALTISLQIYFMSDIMETSNVGVKSDDRLQT